MPVQQSREIATHLKNTHPDRVPVILHKAVNCNDIISTIKSKYLVPKNYSLGQFIFVIRKRLRLASDKALFVFVDNVLPPTGALFEYIYAEYADNDGFLYMTYSGENAFG